MLHVVHLIPDLERADEIKPQFKRFIEPLKGYIS